MAQPVPIPSIPRARAARTAMAALAESHDVFETFFDSAWIGLALADLTGRYVRVNDTYALLLGLSAEDLVGVDLVEVLEQSPEPLPGASTGPLPTSVGAGWEAERRYVRTDGRVVWVLHGVAAVAGSDGLPAWLAVSAQDITERRRVEHELRELTAALTERAVRDPLTGLANRVLFEERLRASLARDARAGSATGVLFLDLDGFKAVNDEHGHAVGDAVLRGVAGRLTQAVRPSDTVARFGGDEFVVLVEDADSSTIDSLTARLADAVREPLKVGRRRLVVGVSVGLSLARGGDADPAGLLAQADAHMYDAKRRAG